MSECTNIAGHNAKIHMIDEVNYGETPDAAAWDWMGTVKGFTPTFSPNVTKVTGVGSRRYIDRLDGDYQVALRSQVSPPRGSKNLLDFLKMALGSATGVTDLPLPSKSIEAYLLRPGDNYYLANLYNGVKMKTFGLTWTYGQGIDLSLDMVAQAVQPTKISTGTPDWLSSYEGIQGSSGDPLTIGSRNAMPPSVKPYNFTNIPRPQIDWGSGLVDLPPVDTLNMTVNNGLVMVPGMILGADGLWYPFPECWAEEGQELTIGLTINPRQLDAYQRLLARTDAITKLRMIINHPTGSGLISSTLDFTGGGIDTGDMDIKELVLMKQPLTLSFNGASLTTV